MYTIITLNCLLVFTTRVIVGTVLWGNRDNRWMEVFPMGGLSQAYIASITRKMLAVYPVSETCAATAERLFQSG